jgi:RNA polymerase sigma-70 factor (ECF subfamily)
MADARETRFQEIVDSGRARFARIARAYAPGADAQDLYQEVLLQIWKSLDRFEGRSQLDTWAYRIALNTAITWRRRLSTRPPPAAAVSPPPEIVGGRDVRDPLQLLDEFLASLGKTDRALLLLYLEDLSYREMAEVLGISESYVGVKVNRIKQAFVERYIAPPDAARGFGSR